MFPCGGAERVTIDIANYLSGYGYESFVALCHKTYDVAGIEVIELPNKDINSLENANAFIEIINSLFIDVFVLPIHLLKHLDYIMDGVHCKLVFAPHSIPLWEGYSGQVSGASPLTAAAVVLRRDEAAQRLRLRLPHGHKQTSACGAYPYPYLPAAQTRHAPF